MNMTSAVAVVGVPALITPVLEISAVPPTLIVSVNVVGVSESADAETGRASTKAAPAADVSKDALVIDNALLIFHPLDTPKNLGITTARL
jgi:hypothetical protein